MVTSSILPPLAVLAPALGALLIAFTGERRANLREAWSVAAGVVMFALVAGMIPDVLAGGAPGCVLLRILPGIEGIAFCYLDDADVVRHRLVRDIIRAYAEDAQG